MNGNYPLGAEYLPNAPFNQPKPFDKEYDVDVTATLTCDVTIISRDPYYDSDGELCEENVCLGNDFAEQLFSPRELVKMFYNLLSEHQEIKFSDRDKVIRSAAIWIYGGEDVDVEER